MPIIYLEFKMGFSEVRILNLGNIVENLYTKKAGKVGAISWLTMG